MISSSPDDSDEHHVTRSALRSKKKGKSKLATNFAIQSQRSQEFEHEHSARDDWGSTASTGSRRRPRDENRSSKTLESEFDGQEGANLEARFNASGCSPSIVDGSTHQKSLETSSSSTHLEESEESEEEEDVHDTKGNPSDDSPYAQVRASVAPTDNTSLSIDTPRMWFLSIIFAIAGSSTNLFFSLRYPSVSLTPIIALLLVHPLGLLWDQIFKRFDDPDETFVNGCLLKSSYSSQISPYKTSWKRRFRLWLAQGQWNAKEHCCVYVSSNVSFGFAFATDVSTSGCGAWMQLTNISVGHCRTSQILSPRSGHHLPDPPCSINANFGLLSCGAYTTLPCPAKRYDLASYIGIDCHVYRAASGREQACQRMDYISTQIFRTRLHGRSCVLLSAWPPLSCFEFIQRYHMVCTPKRYCSKPCMFMSPWTRNSANHVQFGTASGLGLFPVTFDWAQIAYIGSPLVTPFWAAMNIVGGLVLVMWLAAPIMCKSLTRQYRAEMLRPHRLYERHVFGLHADIVCCRLG
jgi:hypothetical protein